MNTKTENGSVLMCDLLGQITFLNAIAGASERPARISALQESEQDLTAIEVPSFERYFALSGKCGQKIDLNGLSTKMLRECYQATKDLTSLQFSLKWTNSGTMQNGLFSTQSITEYPKTGKECILSDILEQERVDRKYFLSAEQMKKIVLTSTSSDTETVTDETRKCSLREGGVEALDTATGGGRGHHTAIPMFGIDYNTSGQERQIANTVTTRNTVNGLTNIEQDGTAVCEPMCIDPQGRTNKKVLPSDTAPTLRAQAHGNNPEICIPVLTPDRTEKRQNGRRFKENGEEAFTLTGQDIHGVALKVKEAQNTAIPVIWYDKYNCYIAIRKLTPKECFRLQGVPDEYFEKAKFVNSDSQLYKQAGNAVTVNVVYEIGKRLKEIEECENNAEEDEIKK